MLSLKLFQTLICCYIKMSMFNHNACNQLLKSHYLKLTLLFSKWVKGENFPMRDYKLHLASYVKNESVQFQDLLLSVYFPLFFFWAPSMPSDSWVSLGNSLHLEVGQSFVRVHLVRIQNFNCFNTMSPIRLFIRTQQPLQLSFSHR